MIFVGLYDAAGDSLNVRPTKVTCILLWNPSLQLQNNVLMNVIKYIDSSTADPNDISRRISIGKLQERRTSNSNKTSSLKQPVFKSMRTQIAEKVKERGTSNSNQTSSLQQPVFKSMPTQIADKVKERETSNTNQTSSLKQPVFESMPTEIAEKVYIKSSQSQCLVNSSTQTGDMILVPI